MHFSQIIALASSVALVAAAPKPIVITEDDVILHGNGHFMVVKRDVYADLAAARNASRASHPPPMPGNLNTTLFHGPSSADANKPAPPPAKPGKRGSSQTIIVKNPHSRFLGWDVLMSSVVKGAPTTISVSAGYQLSNSVSVGASASFTLVKDFLSASTSIDYTQSWTSSTTQQFSAEVPAGKYGAFVSNPWTDRESGNVFTGTIGSAGSLVYYQADSFTSKGYGNLAWVDGAISLCTGDTFPLARCLGGGTL